MIIAIMHKTFVKTNWRISDKMILNRFPYSFVMYLNYVNRMQICVYLGFMHSFNILFDPDN